MQLKIGEVIKQLRIAHSITQEKLADYLNVSAQSISKWENGLSYPDITLIPTIALFFNISTDELFSLSTYTHTQKFTDYKTQYDSLKRKGSIRECIALCREMFVEYPRNYIVLSDLADSLISCYEGLDANHQLAVDNHYLDEAVKLNELILSDCNDLNLKLHATLMLCKYYPLVNQKDKALTLIEQFSSLDSCKERLLEEVLEGEACIKQQQTNLLKLTDLIAQTLIHLSFTKGKNIPHLSMDEKIDFVLSANKLYQLIIPDENYLYFHSRLARNHRRLADLYLAKHDPESCLLHLNQAFYHAKCYDELPSSSHYTSPFISFCEFDKNTYPNNEEVNECERLRYMMTAQGVFDTLNKEPRFIKLVEKLT